MRKLIALIALFVIGMRASQAQELLCQVKVLDNQIQLSDKKIFRTLEQALTEFMNTRIWTTEKFQPNERIECNIQIVLSAYDVRSNKFNGTMQVQSTRPAFA